MPWIPLLLSGSAILMPLQGCYGNFNLTRKVYQWNGHLGDKWINSVVMFALTVVPVYEACGALDYVVFNTIQFWTGNNPVTLRQGMKEVQFVRWQGHDYMLTATTNRMDVQRISNGKAGAPVSLLFDIPDKSLVASASGEKRKVIEMVGEDGKTADFIYPDGHRQRMDLASE